MQRADDEEWCQGCRRWLSALLDVDLGVEALEVWATFAGLDLSQR